MKRLTPRPIHLLLLVAVLLTSCARMCGKMAYDNEISSSTTRFVYHDLSAQDLWRETAGILSEEGWDPDISAPPLDESYLTRWQGEPGARSRVAVRILEIDRRRLRLQIHRVSEYEHQIYPAGYDPLDPNARPLDPAQIRYETRISRTRDPITEWAVLQRAAPEEALLIEGEALRRQEMTQEVVANGCQ